MNNFHEQAMCFVYQQVLQRLLGFFSRPERIALQLLIQRLLVAAGGVEHIGHYRVMVVHEGGKECAYTLAFLRAAQLSIAGRSPHTFILRIAILRQPRMTANVMERIQAQCSELFIYDDSRVELLLVDEQGTAQLHKQVAFESLSSVMDRTQVLMSGHLTQGDARATFFYADLLARAKLYRRACEWGVKVDALIDRRPPAHLGQYVLWIQQVARQHGHAPYGEHREDFEGAVKLCSKLDDDYKQQLQLPTVPSREISAVETDNDINVINVFDCLCHEVDVLHSQVLMFIEGPWNIKTLDIEEPQTAVVLLAAHVHGLRGAYQHGVEYSVGVDAFLRRASIENKCNERFKGQLIKHLGTVFNTPKRISKLHGAATRYLRELHGVSDEQLGCLICSPFVNQARGLESFLQSCYPEKLQFIHRFRQVLIDHNAASQADVSWLESVSGLSLASLQALYHMQKIDSRPGNSLIATLWAHDPNNKPWCAAPAGQV
ncbi:hypothetical protein [Pseudomonas sp. ML2-2023-6]|uniref:hypothetical protein n=1 Tax=Pseudomonas sp. ML2-2023-6 TaxID=3122376 RepID=UPI0030CF9555